MDAVDEDRRAEEAEEDARADLVQVHLEDVLVGDLGAARRPGAGEEAVAEPAEEDAGEKKTEAQDQDTQRESEC